MGILLAMLLLLAAACSPTERVRATGGGGPDPLPAPGLLAPAILYPRHRILPAVPVTYLAVLRHQGKVTVEWRTASGGRRTMHTIQRTIPWPPELKPLRPGEAGWLRLDTPEGRAGAGFVRARVRLPRTEPLLGWRRTGSRLLELGLPAEAVRLWALEGCPRVSWLERALRRSGFPRTRLW